MKKFMLIVGLNLLLFLSTPFLSCGGDPPGKEPVSGKEVTAKDAGSTEKPTAGKDAATPQDEAAPQDEAKPEDRTAPPDERPVERRKPPVPDQGPALPKPNTKYEGPAKSPSGALTLEAKANDFVVPKNTAHHIQCFVLEASNKDARLISRFEPMVPSNGLVRRMTLSLDQSTRTGDWDCTSTNADADKNVMLFAWGTGVGAFQFPEKSGINLPAGAKLRLRIWYRNNSAQDVKDSSGLRVMHLNAVSGAKSYLLLHRKTEDKSVGAGRSETQSVGCTLNAPIETLAVFPWMQDVGRTYISEVLRKGGDREELIYTESWKTKTHRQYYSAPFRFQAEDRFVTTCEWRNASDKEVKPGTAQGQESCEAFLYVSMADFSKFDALCKAEQTGPKPPKPLVYKAGKCAPKDGAKTLPSLKGKISIGDIDKLLKFKGGKLLEGKWKLSALEAVFKPSPLLSYLKTDLTQAVGQVKVGKTDIALDVHIQVVAEFGGRYIPLDYKVSLAGLIKKGDKPEQFKVTLTCGKFDYPVFYFEDDKNELLLGTKLAIKTGFGNVEYSVKLRFQAIK